MVNMLALAYPLKIKRKNKHFLVLRCCHSQVCMSQYCFYNKFFRK